MLHSQIVDLAAVKVARTTTADLAAKAEASTTPFLALLKAGLTFGYRRRRTEAVEGTLGPVQKLAAIIDRLEADGRIQNLNEAIRLGAVEGGAKCFTYTGAFTCLQEDSVAAVGQDHPTYLAEEEKATAPSGPEGAWGKLKTIGRMCVLHSRCGDFDLFLACSTKYFSDMGASRIVVGDDFSDNDLVEITPHSGNHHFFAGHHAAHFEALLFLTGQSGSKLFGSPVVLVNAFSPDLAI
jgi:hypothetical protein